MHHKTQIQYLLPHHLLSRMIGSIANCRWLWLKNILINLFIKRYDVDLSEAKNHDPAQYSCFNDFFTRALKSGARPLPTEPDSLIISPVDGRISQIGHINEQQIIQAKNRLFSLQSLLGDQLKEYFDCFENGSFATIYLAPADYHRVHMPIGGKLIKTVHIPGKLFSVNPLTANEIDNLYAKNERVIALFMTDIGPMAVILVGAMLVASIKTAWQGVITSSKKIRSWDHKNDNLSFNIGDEIGQFQFGSTVILLLPKNKITWNYKYQPNDKINMGYVLALHTKEC